MYFSYLTNIDVSMDGILLVLCKLLLSIVLYSVLSYGSLNSTPPQRFTRVKAEFFKLLHIRINYFQIIYQGAYRKWFLLFILTVGYTYFSFSAIIMSFCLILYFIILMEKKLLRQQKRKYDALDILELFLIICPTKGYFIYFDRRTFFVNIPFLV